MELNKNMIIVGILVLLVVASAVQAFQLINIKSNINNVGTNKVVKTTSSSTSTSGNAEVPTNLQNLPGMVGGC